MSGILGIVNLDGAPVERQLLARMTQMLAFRGPDAQRIWCDGAVGLGHTLLRTTPESEREQQPASLDGRRWITADARIDDRPELIRKLESRGRTALETATDAELILHAYHAWGEQCLEHLLGDFAFAIWDGPRAQLWCARDHFGLKPFFYARVGNCLVFSNTLAALRAHPQVSDRLNDLAIADFLLFGWHQEPAQTCFADIQRLPLAHTLSYADGAVGVSRYWSLPVEGPIRYQRPSEYVEHFQELLRVAVSDRLRTDQAGVLMSGGLDSASVAAVAQQVLSSRGAPFDLRAYTVDYRPLFADEESHYAGLVAKKIGIPLHVACAANCTPYERWDQPELRKPEPMHEPLMAVQYDLMRQIAEHSRVALTGDGGDNLLHGQSWPYLVSLCKEGKFARLAGEVGRYALSHGRLPAPLAGFRSKFVRWLGREMDQPEYPRWIERSLETRLDLRARWQRLNRREQAPVHPLRPRAYESLANPYWSLAYEFQNPGVTRVPVEVRAPFLDLRLVRFMLALPPVPWCVDKELLRVAMRGVLPEAVRLRPKAPLAGDPVTASLRCKGWRAKEHFSPLPVLAQYAEPDRVPLPAGHEDPQSIWLNLRPLSLNYWLQYGLPFSINCGSEVGDEAIGPHVTEEALSKSPTARLRQPR